MIVDIFFIAKATTQHRPVSFEKPWGKEKKRKQKSQCYNKLFLRMH